jgi:PhoH-like ATPase
LQVEPLSDEIKVSAIANLSKNDNAILLAALTQREKRSDREVILVSRDINLRIKAAAVSLKAEDREAGSAVEDADVLRTGIRQENGLWDSVSTTGSCTKEGRKLWEVEGARVKAWEMNEFLSVDDGELCVQVVAKEGLRATLRQIVDHSKEKNAVWGLTAKSLEQSCALNLLTDPNIDLVTLLGQAGSGKTIMTLAACLDMLYTHKTHEELIFTRITVPVGDDIGFLPGSEEEKMMPWMGALEDNLEELARTPNEDGGWGRQATQDFLWSKIRVKSLNFMRGRTFTNKIVVIDEAQNLTPKQMKTLITRAGPGSKIVCLGNLAQIDTPYLTETSCGLTHVVEGMKGYKGHGHTTLAKVERSALAEFAGKAL